MTSNIKEFPDYVPEDGITAAELIAGIFHVILPNS